MKWRTLYEIKAPQILQLMARWLVLLQLQRFIFAAAFVRDFSWAELFWAWFVGTRLDLMVLGFFGLFFLPLLYMQGRYFQTALKSPSQFLHRFFVWGSFFVFLLDGLHYVIFQDRLTLNTVSGFLWIDFNRYEVVTKGGFLFFLGVCSALAVHWSGRRLLGIPVVAVRGELILGLALVFALAARGTFAERHLDLRHSVISNNNSINLMTIPSWYALDQAIRGRR